MVDTIEHELHGLKKAFTRCKLHYITDPRYILRALGKVKFDVIITSSILDNNDVSVQDILKSISQKYPNIVRVVVNKEGDETNFNQVAHYNFLSPFSYDEVSTIIERLAQTNQTITKSSIIKIVSKIKSLPTPPRVYLQLSALLEQNNTDSHKISEIITQDPALTAKVLQVSNSFSLNKGKTIKDISEAITKMGVDALCCIVMTAELFSHETDIENFSLIDEQLHCLHTAKLAASLVKPELKQETMLSGLLHDIGKLVLLEIDPKLSAQFLKNHNKITNSLLLEEKIFKTNHCQIGAYLLHCWNFSYDIIENIIHHHAPEKLCQKKFGAPQAVYLANALLRGQEPDERFVVHYKMTALLDTLRARAEKYQN